MALPPPPQQLPPHVPCALWAVARSGACLPPCTLAGLVPQLEALLLLGGSGGGGAEEGRGGRGGAEGGGNGGEAEEGAWGRRPLGCSAHVAAAAAHLGSVSPLPVVREGCVWEEEGGRGISRPCQLATTALLGTTDRVLSCVDEHHSVARGSSPPPPPLLPSPTSGSVPQPPAEPLPCAASRGPPFPGGCLPHQQPWGHPAAHTPQSVRAAGRGGRHLHDRTGVQVSREDLGREGVSFHTSVGMERRAGGFPGPDGCSLV